jgi:hypothetical protein
MDPNFTLKSIKQYVADGDYPMALDCLEALGSWVTRGGFLPTEPTRFESRGQFENWREAMTAALVWLIDDSVLT